MSSLAATDDRTAPVAGPRPPDVRRRPPRRDRREPVACLLARPDRARRGRAHGRRDPPRGRRPRPDRPAPRRRARAGPRTVGPLSRRDPPSERGGVRPRAGEDRRRGSAAGADRSHLLEGDIPRRSGRDPARAHPRDARARRRGHGRAGVRHHPGLERPAAGNDRTARCPRRPLSPDRPGSRAAPADRHDGRPRPPPCRRPRSDAAFLHGRDRVRGAHLRPRHRFRRPQRGRPLPTSVRLQRLAGRGRTSAARGHGRPPVLRAGRPAAAAFVRSASASTPTDTHTSSREAS